MKLLNTKTIAAIAIATAFSFGNANAMNSTTTPVNSIVGLTSTDLTVNIDDGVATLFGSVDSGIESALAQAEIEKLDGVNKVINLVRVN